MGGQRWYMKFYPDGDRSESADWISLYVQLDDSDDVEVKARLKFSVLDDMGGSVPTFSRESSSLDIFCSKHQSCGFTKFVARKKDLEESSYLKDDCLKVRCDLTVSKNFRAEAHHTVCPPSNMHQHFGWLLSDAVGADYTFEVAGEVFAAHRYVLAVCFILLYVSSSLLIHVR